MSMMADFVDYVLSFYGKLGPYDMEVSRDDVLLAIGMRLNQCKWGTTNEGGKFKCEGFEGDSFDREAVRDILIERFGYKWPEAA